MSAGTSMQRHGSMLIPELRAQRKHTLTAANAPLCCVPNCFSHPKWCLEGEALDCGQFCEANRRSEQSTMLMHFQKHGERSHVQRKVPEHVSYSSEEASV